MHLIVSYIHTLFTALSSEVAPVKGSYRHLQNCKMYYEINYIIASKNCPDSKVHGANMGPIWGRQDPGGPHVGPMTLDIWASTLHCFSF